MVRLEVLLIIGVYEMLLALQGISAIKDYLLSKFMVECLQPRAFDYIESGSDSTFRIINGVTKIDPDLLLK